MYIRLTIGIKTLYISIILYNIGIQIAYNSGEVNIWAIIHMYIQ